MLQVTEIFASIQGETSHIGLPFAFVRLAGCNLRCRYCDTTYAYEGGEALSIQEIVSRVEIFGIPRVTVTGGEPLLQPEAFDLVTAFLDREFVVLVETNGTVPLGPLDPRAVKVMDVKCPGSGEDRKTVWENFSALTARDEVKFVVASEDDYRYAKEIMGKYCMNSPFSVLISPAFGFLPPEKLAGWMVGDGLSARFQLQLHKIVWGPDARGV
ncbi:MAG: 7-carboxy-7-deazaguanine synthase [Deltaproteobacteria bacterium]|nr:MAG: 7-carboxy-7-deazaguanine synthase [Deltaproteobacteria bacterium]